MPTGRGGYGDPYGRQSQPVYGPQSRGNHHASSRGSPRSGSRGRGGGESGYPLQPRPVYAPSNAMSRGSPAAASGRGGRPAPSAPRPFNGYSAQPQALGDTPRANAPTRKPVPTPNAPVQVSKNTASAFVNPQPSRASHHHPAATSSPRQKAAAPNPTPANRAPKAWTPSIRAPPAYKQHQQQARQFQQPTRAVQGATQSGGRPIYNQIDIAAATAAAAGGALVGYVATEHVAEWSDEQRGFYWQGTDWNGENGSAGPYSSPDYDQNGFYDGPGSYELQEGSGHAEGYDQQGSYHEPGGYSDQIDYGREQDYSQEPQYDEEAVNDRAEGQNEGGEYQQYGGDPQKEIAQDGGQDGDGDNCCNCNGCGDWNECCEGGCCGDDCCSGGCFGDGCCSGDCCECGGCCECGECCGDDKEDKDSWCC